MAYKGRHITARSAVDFNKQLKNFLLDCGWVHADNSPTRDGSPGSEDSYRIAQEDKHAFILGWFLHSNGEDGNKDVHIHLGWQNVVSGVTAIKGITAYLSASITADAQNISAVSVTGLSGGDIIQIGEEIIQIGSITGTTLTSCTRGYAGSTASTHDAGDVIARVTNAAPGIMVYGFRDLNGPVLSSAGTPTWNFGTTTPVSNVQMADGTLSTTRDTNKHNNTSLIRFADGRMRWLTAQTVPATGYFMVTYDALYSAPGNVHCDIIPAGAFPHVSRHSGANAGRIRSHVMYTTGFVGTPRDCWLYGSKDGVAAVISAGNGAYVVFYWGTYVPFANKAYTVTTDTVAKGAVTIKVSNINLFSVGGRYVILSQHYQDWTNNRDCSASTYMGAAGSGQWANLDGDETAFEHFVVTGIDELNSTITISTGTCYSYMTGAVVGEDPRPHCGYSYENDGEYYIQFGDTSHYATAVCFHTSAQSRLGTHPCHRIRWRCCTNTTTQFKPDGTIDPWGPSTVEYTYFAAVDMTANVMGIGIDFDARFSRGHLAPFRIQGSGTDANWWKYGGDINRWFGFIPAVRYTANAWGGVSEDTIKVMWNGQLETFRLFWDTWAGQWRAMGPEIA